MHISSIKVTGFRNLKTLQLDFSDKRRVLAFVGENGQGKTNLLESIYLCALSKSFRSKGNQDLISFDQDFCRIELELELESEKKKLEFFIDRTSSQKVLKVNGVKKTAMDFVGILKVVFFSPDDLSEMSFSPRLRRRYLNVLLSQLDRDYLVQLSSYEQVRKQRNALLKKIRDQLAKEEELFFWDEKLAFFGLRIIKKRQEVLGLLKDKIIELYKSISGQEKELDAHYFSTIENPQDEKGFLKALKNNRRRDLSFCNTHVGPHRDDLTFLMDGRDMTLFASRGEWRSLILSLKFAEFELIKEQIGQAPILLLDDVFSELDEKRQTYLFRHLNECQTFISTTHASFLKDAQTSGGMFKVESGRIFS